MNFLEIPEILSVVFDFCSVKRKISLLYTNRVIQNHVMDFSSATTLENTECQILKEFLSQNLPKSEWILASQKSFRPLPIVYRIECEMEDIFSDVASKSGIDHCKVENEMIKLLDLRETVILRDFIDQMIHTKQLIGNRMITLDENNKLLKHKVLHEFMDCPLYDIPGMITGPIEEINQMIRFLSEYGLYIAHIYAKEGDFYSGSWIFCTQIKNWLVGYQVDSERN